MKQGGHQSDLRLHVKIMVASALPGCQPFWRERPWPSKLPLLLVIYAGKTLLMLVHTSSGAMLAFRRETTPAGS